MLESNLHNETVVDILQAVLEDGGDTEVVVTRSGDVIESLVTVMGALETPPVVQLLAPEDPLRTTMDDFVVAGSAADLAEEESLHIRATPDPDGTVIVMPAAVVSVVTGSDAAAGLVSTNADFVAAMGERYDRMWDEAEQYALRTPPLSEVRSTLESAIGPETAQDFDAVLASLETLRGDGGLDEVTISLLVAAKNRELLYDISKWGEDVGIASKATFSRTKTTLEDMGLIDTEKVPIDVGRPRLRLLLGDDRLRDADAGELANVAQSMLGS